MKIIVSNLKGFAPITPKEPRVLILGSIPSEASIQKQQYYGHARNTFWPIMEALFGTERGQLYSQRKQILLEHDIALWDVLQSCQRKGSLDSNIAMESIQVNNFADFFNRYRQISRVFFNGGMAENVYKKFILPELASQFSYLEYCRLPSTSPANASLNFNEKLEAWRVIKQHVVK